MPNTHTEWRFLARASGGLTHRGRSAAEVCAKAVGISRSAFQEFISVTSHWKPADIRALLVRSDSEGRALTMHHLLVVARTGPHLRQQLRRIVCEGSDIKELRAVLNTSRSGYAIEPDDA